MSLRAVLAGLAAILVPVGFVLSVVCGGAFAVAPAQDGTGAQAAAPAAAGDGLPDGPTWGRGGFQPRGKNVLFASGDGCALCHSHSESASALTSATGDDVSPFGLWQGTLMANAFRDPYWRAQMAHEVEKRPGRKAEIEALCFRCHAPMAHHTARIAGRPVGAFEELQGDPLAQDGVSCTVCHQIQPAGLGEPASFDGRITIEPGRRIFGPYEEPQAQPMRMHSAYQATHGAWIQDSGLCGACHTLHTASPVSGAKPFPEQTPYLEWKNSVFAAETGGTPGAEARSCQDCHMPDVGAMKIARNPGGGDFNIPIRDGVKAHAIVGGNAFMLDLLRERSAEFGVVADDESMLRLARAARAQLAHDTARLTIENAVRHADRLTFDLRVENLTGHKFPTGYPSRRAWLQIDVTQGRTSVFRSGTPDPAFGRIEGVGDDRGAAGELGLPHLDRVTSPEQVVVYELLAADADGAITTSLLDMATRVKDNRLLPRGWSADGPYAEDTAPVGVDGDPDFGPGGDVVHFAIPGLDPQGPAPLVIARLLYQPIPPAWADGLRESKTPEAAHFLRFYDVQVPRPDLAGLAAQSVQ